MRKSGPHRIVATRPVDQPYWQPMPGIDLAQVRAEYDAGLVELATGRDQHLLYLYRIPRRQPDVPRGYFTPPPLSAHDPSVDLPHRRSASAGGVA